MAIDEKLSQALAQAAAQERKQQDTERRQIVGGQQKWYTALAAERQASVAQNWRSTLDYIAQGQASKEAALEAFLSVFDTEEQTTLRLEGRSKQLLLLPVELARSLLKPPTPPGLLEAYRLWARQQSGDDSAGQKLASVRARIRQEEPNLTAAQERAIEALERLNRLEDDLEAARAEHKQACEAFERSHSWFARNVLPASRQQYQALVQNGERGLQRLEAQIAETSANAELADGEILLSTERLNALQNELARLQGGQVEGSTRLFRPIDLEPQANPLDLVRVPAGRFWMGTADMGSARPEEVPLRRVELTRAFEIGVYPVTQALYQAVMGDHPGRPVRATAPVNQVSWYDACTFCNALSALLGLERAYHIDEAQLKVVRRPGALGFRLPTEAEWAMAARGQESFEYAGDDDIERVAWHKGNSKVSPKAVGLRRPNGLGLFDLSGNVWEWCHDGYDEHFYKTGPKIDPVGPEEAPTRVMRGGSAATDAERCRVAARSSAKPTGKDTFLGFRIARTLPEEG